MSSQVFTSMSGNKMAWLISRAVRQLAIHIDGAAFHVGQRLRQDRFIRDRLRNGNPPWRVEELKATDLGQGEALVRTLAKN